MHISFTFDFKCSTQQHANKHKNLVCARVQRYRQTNSITQKDTFDETRNTRLSHEISSLDSNLRCANAVFTRSPRVWLSFEFSFCARITRFPFPREILSTASLTVNSRASTEYFSCGQIFAPRKLYQQLSNHIFECYDVCRCVFTHSHTSKHARRPPFDDQITLHRQQQRNCISMQEQHARNRSTAFHTVVSVSNATSPERCTSTDDVKVSSRFLELNRIECVLRDLNKNELAFGMDITQNHLNMWFHETQFRGTRCWRILHT